MKATRRRSLATAAAVALALAITAVSPPVITVAAPFIPPHVQDSPVIPTVPAAPFVEATDPLTTPDAPGTQATVKGTGKAKIPAVHRGGGSAAGSVPLAPPAANTAGAGDYSGLPGSSAGAWGVTGQTGAFSWTYPFTVRKSPAGPTPQLGLSYDSTRVDGLTSATNNQASVIGDGWALSGAGRISQRFAPCADQGVANSYDLCGNPGGQKLSVAFGGRASELVKDASTGAWHLANDDGTRIEYLTGGSNGTFDGGYWKLTDPDGIQYFFGLNRLPGWAPGQPVTGSADTVPVGAADPSQPCTAGTFAASLCQQAYGWNLDYVVDPNGNTQSYWYTQDTNSYSTLNGTAGTTVMPYVRASRLTRVDYGMRAGTELGSQAPLHVVLSYANRCTGVDCTGGSDIPTGLTCPAGGPCSLYSPTFYSDQRLTTVQSETLTGGAYHGADSWALAHTFPSPGDGTAPALWLGKVTHSGIDSTAGTTITDPSTVFSGQVLQNRVWVTDGLAPLDRYRITGIQSPTGAVTTVAYSGADCTPTSLPASPQSNTRRCFPQWWTPTTPIVQAARMDWFQIYPVQAVSVDAGPGAPGSLTQTTTYTYLGAPAWRYPELKYRTDTASSKLTWSVLAGWSQVKTVTAASAATTTYLRGLDGTPSNTTGGTVSATVTASDGTIVTDSTWFSGRTLETQSTLGDGGALLKVTSSFPWASAPTATGTTAVGSPTARHLGTGRVWSKSAVAAGWRNTNATTGYDSLGRPVWISDQGDTGTTADDTCTTTAYATGTAANLLHLTAASNTYAGVCNADGTPAGNLLKAGQTFYDGNTAALPGTGYADPVHALPTGSQSASAVTAQAATAWQPGPTVAYDPLGRPASSTDTTTGTARTTSTAYTPATGPATSVTATNPLGWTATNTYDPVRGNTLKSTDANGAVTERAYDASGRPTAGWSALRPRATNPTPTTAVSYSISNTLASWVKTTTVDNSGGTTDSYILYDGLGRVRQTQTPALVGGTDLTDTFYGAAGAVSSRRNAYYTAAVQAGTLVTPTLAVPSTDHYDYDPAGRPTRTLHLAWDNQAEYETDTAYTGTDTTTVTGTAVTGAATAVTDARGHTTAKTTWHGPAASGPADTTNYAYDPLGNLARMTDQAGNTWTWTLDPLGREKSRTDPDTGTTTTAYDPSGRKAAVTDANNTATSSTYDALDRVTGTTTTLAGQGAKALTSTTWDTPTKGRVGSQTRYNGPNQDQPVTTTYANYNAAYQPGDLKLTLPAAFGTLAGTYETTIQYGATGLPTITSLPAVGPLPGEAVQNAWNALDLPAGLASATGVRYAANASYNNLNLLGGYEQNDTNATGTGVDTMGDTTVQNTWDATTGLLSTTQAWNTAGTTTSDLGRTDYSYDTTGRITSTALSYPTRATAPAPDRQCYSYDWANRLSQAWTTAAADCTAGFSTAAIGGPAPYAQAYTYTTSGDRAATTRYNANGTTAVSEAYTYGNGGPHRLQNVARTTGTTTTTDTFAYDPAGQMTNRGGQTLAYTPDGKLATTTGTSTVPLNPNSGAPTGTPVVSGASQTGTRYYTADGALAGITDGTGTTALIGNATAYQPAGTGPTTGTRTYAFAGKSVAQRTATTATTGSTTAFITSDTTNTAQTITTATTGNGTTPVTVTTRRTDPYGLTRAPTLTASGNTPLATAPASATGPGSNTANPGAFSAATGYLTGTADAATALTHLGARDLDPVLGAFTSPDPVLDTANQNNYSPYIYANADPINGSDPSGLFDSGMGTWVGVSLPAWFGAATALGVGAAVGGAGVLLGLGLPFIGAAAAPGMTQDELDAYHQAEWATVPKNQPAIDAGNASLSFDRPSIGTAPGTSDGSGEADYGFTPSYYAGGYAPKDPAGGIPSVNNFAAAQAARAARKAAEAAAAALGKANNAQTAADATGGGRGTGGPSTRTGLADPGGDDFIDQIANGHAYTKHVEERGEFPGIRSRGAFAEKLQQVARDGLSRTLAAGRTAYWNDGTVVIRDLNHIEGGTAFRMTFDKFLGL